MVRDTARRRAARPVETLVADLRASAGSRRLPPFTNHLTSLLDLLVHGQDVAVPLGRHHPMPPAAARVAADRIWSMGWPFRARRRFAGVTLSATDVAWTRGAGPRIEGPIEAILLLLAGRAAGLSRLTGAGTAKVSGRVGRPAE